MARTLRHVASFAVLPLLAIRCAGASRDTGDASTEASMSVPLVDARLTDVVLPTCGDTRCTEPGTAGVLAEAACCLLPSGGCGLRSLVLDTACLPRAPRGGVDLECPERAFPGGATLPGCCAKGGRCGLLDSDGELGCVAVAPDARACAYRADNDCTSLVELPCDGPEDCDSGTVCCGRARNDRYDRFVCSGSCDAIRDGQGGVWVEICHPGDRCLNPLFVCEPSALLPSFLARCHAPGPPPVSDAGDASLDADASPARDVSAPPPSRPAPGVACGNQTCRKDEKCCLRRHSMEDGSPSAPIDPYCEHGDGSCSCFPQVDP